MPRICYDTDLRDRLRRSPRMAIVDQANAIITEYAQQGFTLTLRQLYYQFVARDVLANRQTEYKRLGDIIVDARMAGLLDWSSIVDRTRSLRDLAHWNDPPEIVRAVADQFRIDKWAQQQTRVEVWIEKDALVGVIEGVCQELDVPYFSCRGYTSISEIWAAGRRMRARSSQETVVLHLGDHDPSGIDMTRDIRDRLRTFAERPIDVRRLALNMDQVREYNPPPNPAKTTDSRSANYIQEYGEDSWELDALEPAALAALIRTEVLSLRDEETWDESVSTEDTGKAELALIADRYHAAVEHLRADEDAE